MITGHLPIGSRIRDEHGEEVWTIAGWDAEHQCVRLELHDINTAASGIVPPLATEPVDDDLVEAIESGDYWVYGGPDHPTDYVPPHSEGRP